ncbi:MAG: ABC transporter ATP-binding protein [Planctomycetota bacterium]
MSSLSLRGISKRFGEHEVLTDISIDVAAGEFLVLVGPSGCGKSTLLRIIAGLIPASAGDIVLDGERVNDVEPRARDVAMVFQNYALYPHMTVRRNLAFPLKLSGVDRAAVARRVQETAEVLGLTGLLDRRPGTLSGGQMQRVAVGRAIIRNPRVFLFDEPLSNLDAKLRAEMRGEIARLHTRLGITTVYVTHDQAEAMTMGSRICVLDDGAIQQVGAPIEVFSRPANAFVASFIGSPAMNLLRGRVEAGRFRIGTIAVPCDAAPDGHEVVLGIRPHEVGGGGPFTLEVVYSEELGSQTHLHCAVGDQTLLVTREGHVPLPRGTRLPVSFPSDVLHWFDARSGERRRPISG